MSYTYDAGTNGKGHMTSLADQAGTGSYIYDALGRIATETRVITGVSKSIGYGYNLDGSLKTLTYPSGRILTYTPTENGTITAGRLGQLRDVANNINFVSGGTGASSFVSHAPDGSLTSFVMGYGASFTGISSLLQYNPRLQLCRITALTSGTMPSSCSDSAAHGNLIDRGYNFGLGADNNGNVLSITNYRDPTRNQNFTYDALNRIASGWTDASTGSLSWGENYSIDAWGNLEIAPMAGKTAGGNWQCAADANNRANCLAYDIAGNVTANGTAHYTFDAENRLASAGGMTYSYDADGNRVEKSSGSTGTLYWYGSPGILAESDLNGNIQHEYAFFGGKRVARIDQPGNSVHYYLSDHLGSTSMVLSSSGVPEEESDYSPFGTEYVVSGPGANRYKFSGKERDVESGLDNFGARYYGSSMGRFMSPDPVMVMRQKMLDPQQWNMYSYARNNPLRFKDENGKWPTDIHEKIIDKAFPGLSQQQRDTLKKSSYWMDHCATCQMKSHNHEHFMKAPGEDPGKAKQGANDFIHKQEGAAQKDQGGTPKNASDINSKSLGDFGQALHTVTDGTSPAHVDSNGNPRDWNGIPGTPGGYDAVKQHESEESTISPQQMDTAVQAARDVFGQTYGPQAQQQAETPPPPKKEEPK